MAHARHSVRWGRVKRRKRVFGSPGRIIYGATPLLSQSARVPGTRATHELGTGVEYLRTETSILACVTLGQERSGSAQRLPSLHMLLAHMHFGTGAEWLHILAHSETSEQPFPPFHHTSTTCVSTPSLVDYIFVCKVEATHKLRAQMNVKWTPLRQKLWVCMWSNSNALYMYRWSQTHKS